MDPKLPLNKKVNDRIALEAQRLGIADWAEESGIHIPTMCDKYLDQFLTTDSELIAIKQKIHKLAPSSISILIEGETGTGKELIAQALHGPRQGQFIAVNTAGIPDTLLESEFFGVEKGAYTGADKQRDGLLKQAFNGTLFLDEIGDMPMMMQSKLLRVIQEKRARALGSSIEYPVNCRFIAATHNMRLGETIRPDLYYRLAGYVVRLKPLRDRPIEDVRLICKAKEFEVTDKFKIDYKWPGNVRELLNIIEAEKILNFPNNGELK